MCSSASYCAEPIFELRFRHLFFTNLNCTIIANSSENRLSLVIEERIIEEAFQKIEELNTLLDFLITLTKEERNRRISLDSANKLFVDEALEEGKLRPTLVPSFINLAEAEKDFTAFSKLIPVRNSLDTFWQKLHDIMLFLGDEAWSPALRIYANIKEARKHGVAGAEEAYQRLKKRFEGQGKSQKGGKTDNPPTTEPPTQ